MSARRYTEEWLKERLARKAEQQDRVKDSARPLMIVGIDPGISGGIAKLKQDGSLWLPSAVGMPASEEDISDYLWSLNLEAKEADSEILCFLEQVQVMPAIRRVKTEDGEQRVEANPGIVSTAKFMQGYGFIRGCLITIGIPVENIRPQAWQKLLGCMTRGNKNISKNKAEKLFPTLQVTHKIADALCIAEAGKKIRMGLSAGALFESSRKKVMPWEQR